MSFLSDLGDTVGGFVGMPNLGSNISNVWDSLTNGGIGSGVLGYVGQQDTNSANAAIHASDNAFNADQSELQRQWSASEAAKTRDFNDWQGQKARDYATEMSNTQWQRGVKDMEAAGLSPMLAYMKGGASAPVTSAASSSTPSGSAASAASPLSMGNAMQAGLTSANMAADTANKLATKTLIDSQINATDNQANLTASQIAQVDATVDKIKAETDKIRGDTSFEDQQLILKRTAELILQQSSVLFSEVSNKAQQYDVLKATVAKVVSETTLNNLDIKAADALGNSGRIGAQLKPIIDIFRTILRGR